MTTITMHLPDDLVQEAKQAGVLNEQALAELCGQFLRTHLSLSSDHAASDDDMLPNGSSPLQPLQTAKSELSYKDIAGALKSKTSVKATIEEMNQSIVDMFKHWEG